MAFMLLASMTSPGQVNFTTNPPDTADYPYWVKMMEDPSVNFFDVQRAFNIYWEGRPIEKGSGFKPFKRWEYMTRLYQINPDGTRLPSGHSYREYQEYMATHSPARSVSGDWTNLGPFNIPSKGYEGLGRLNAIAFHPTDANIIWAGAPAGGLWKTTTGGNSWNSTTDNLPSLGVSAILIDYTNPSVMYLGTGDPDHGDAAGLGVFRSTDGGNTWAPWRNGMGNCTVGRLIMHPSNNQIILAATSSGVYKTTDGGANWSQVQSGNFKEIVFKADDPSVVFASAEGNFYRSTDTGQNFTQITSGLPTDAYRGVIGVTTADANYIYFLLTNPESYYGLYRSTDAGLNFSLRSNSPNIMSWDCTGGTGGQAWYDLDIAVGTSNRDIVFAGGVNCFKSTDGGANWTISSHWWGDCGVPAVHADLHILEWNPLDGRLYAGNDGGIYYTADLGATWPEITDGMPISQVYKIGQSATVRDKCMNGYQDNGTSTYMGSYWDVTNGGDGMECAVDHKNAAYSYSTIYFGSVYRHQNNNYEGIVCSNGSYGIDEDGAWVTPFILDENDPNIMFVGLKNLWRCTNVKAPIGSFSWTRISYDLGGNNSTNMCVLEQSPANTNILFAGRYDNKLFRSDNAQSGSVTWTDLTASLPENGLPVDLECHPTNPDLVYLSLNNNIWKSTDRGQTWSDISGTLPDVTYSSVVNYKNSNDGLYVSSDVGVFFRDHTMSDWVMFSNGLPVDASINEIEIYYDPADMDQDIIRAGTFGRGLWESDMYHDTPDAVFESSRTSVIPGCMVDFTDMSTGVPTSWHWILQGSETPVSYEPNPDSVMYNTPGTFLVKLVIANEAGADSVTLANYITVSNDVPQVAFTADDTTICTGGTVYFTDASEFCPTQWNWAFTPSTVTFTGGATSSSRHPAVQFDSPGWYDVSLSVTNANGTATMVKGQYIRVGLPSQPFQEEFSSGIIPSCWENIDHQGNGQVWQFNNPRNRPIGTPTAGNGIAILDSDNYGGGNTQNADLVSPPLDFSEAISVNVSFQHHFELYVAETATFSYSIDGGNSWTILDTWVTSTNNPELESYDITAETAGEPDVRFKWNYTGTYGWWWALDDINIESAIPGLWIGGTSSDWSTPANWSGGLTPDGTTDILVPSNAAYWPNYPGNLTLGVQCGNVTLEKGAHFSVSGNLTIPTAYTLDMSRISILEVNGTIFK
jgi:PKD repeat protein